MHHSFVIIIIINFVSKLFLFISDNGCPLSNVSPEYVQLNPSNFPSIVNKTTQVYPNGTVLNWVCKQSDMNLYGMSETVCLYDNKEFYWNKPLPQCISEILFNNNTEEYKVTNSLICCSVFNTA